MAMPAAWPMTAWKAVKAAVHFNRDPVGFITHGASEWGDLYSFGLPKWLPGRKRKLIFAISEEHHRRVLGEGSDYRGSSVSLRGPEGSALNRLRTAFYPRKGIDHPTLRKILWPAFSRSAVEARVNEITGITSQVIDRWQERQLINVWDEMRAITLRISCRLLFGGQSPEEGEAMGEAIQDFFKSTYFSAAMVLQRDWPGTPYRRLLRACERVTSGIDALVAQRQSAPASRNDLLSLMVRGCEQLGAPTDLAGPASFQFAASFETLANVLTWTLFLLAQHPTVMSDVNDELKGALGGSAPDMSRVGELPLLDAVVKESLRLFPPLPMFYRTATRETELGGRRVVAGDWVICSPYLSQRNADAFPEPLRFKPERWFGAAVNPYIYLPYGVGAHSCMGQLLGNTILKLCLTMITQRWRLTVAPGARVDRKVQITLAPLDGIAMRVWGPSARFRAVPVHGNVHEMVALDDVNAGRHILPMPAATNRKTKRRAA